MAALTTAEKYALAQIVVDSFELDIDIPSIYASSFSLQPINIPEAYQTYLNIRDEAEQEAGVEVFIRSFPNAAPFEANTIEKELVELVGEKIEGVLTKMTNVESTLNMKMLAYPLLTGTAISFVLAAPTWLKRVQNVVTAGLALVYLHLLTIIDNAHPNRENTNTKLQLLAYKIQLKKAYYELSFWTSGFLVFSIIYSWMYGLM